MKKTMFVFGVLVTLLSPITASAAVKVVSTIPDFGDIAKAVGGEAVTVEALVKPTQDPHYVDAKPSLMVTLNKADLLLVTGMELEAGWLPPLLTGARNPKIQRGGGGYLDCSTLINPMQVQAVDRAKGDIHPGGNPHFWTDPRNGRRLAKGIADKLIALSPGDAPVIRQHLGAFLKRLDAKMAAWQKALAASRGKEVVVYHESWVYFLDWAGLVQAGALEPKPGIPPKPSHVAALINTVRGRKIKFLIQESFYPTRLSKIFAEKSGAALKVLPTMVGAQGTRDYIDLIDTLVKELTQ